MQSLQTEIIANIIMLDWQSIRHKKIPICWQWEACTLLQYRCCPKQS